MECIRPWVKPIALAADDWRGDREERDRELAYLLAIDTDMKAASDVLETALSDNNEFVRNSSAALAVSSINSVDAAVVNIQEAVTAELAVRGKAVRPEGS